MSKTAVITLEYGQRVMFPAYPCHPTPFGFGIQSVSKDDKSVMVEMEVKKYWQSDIDANQFKVALHPVDKTLPFGIEKLYSMDLKSMISDGTVILLENN